MEPLFEAIELEGDSVIKVFTLCCASLKENHSWHYHPECELTYVIKGSGTRFVGDSVQHFEPGDLIFSGPNLPHCWTNDEDDSDPERNKFLVLQFKPECLGEDFLGLPDTLPLQKLINNGRRGLRFYDQSSDLIVDILEQLACQTGLLRLSSFIRLLDVLCHCKQVETLTSEIYVTDTEGFHGGRIETVMGYVKANLSSDIKQSEVAELVGLTPQGFSRFFRATTGRTFVSFVNVMRIMQACRLLVNTRMDIIDIAFECGYANLSNFNRRFSELKKTTPREYRYKHCKLSQSDRNISPVKKV